MTLPLGIIIKSSLLTEVTEDNGFDDNQALFLNYIYHDLDYSPVKIAEEYFDKKVSYQSIMSWIKKCSVKLKNTQKSSTRTDVTVQKVYELCIDTDGPQLTSIKAGKILNCSHNTIINRKYEYLNGKKRGRKRTSKKYQNALTPQGESKTKRICRSCGCDPYPNYFYCPNCHNNKTLPDNNIDEQTTITTLQRR